MLHEAIALFVGLFFVAQVWLAILESRLGPFSSHALRAALLIMSLALPCAALAARLRRDHRWPRLPSGWPLLLLAGSLVVAIALFESVRPFHPDHDDTFRAGIVQAILGTGFPPSESWWTAAAHARVHYYVLAENIVAQVGALAPRLSLTWLYVHQLKLAYIVCNILLGFSIARDVGALERLVVPGRPLATLRELLVDGCAFVMLVFGATPFELATLHVLGVSQSAIGHTAIVLFVALVLRRPATSGRERLAVDVIIWTLPALLAATKLPYLPPFVAALVVYWLVDGSWRTWSPRSLLLPAYSIVALTLAMASEGMFAAAQKHPLAWMPLVLFHELSPQWFHFAQWPLFWRVATAFGLYDVPIVLLLFLLMRRDGSLPSWLRTATGRVLLLLTVIMLVAYGTVSTIGFVDREGANEIYWLVEGWSAVTTFVFVAVLAAPRSWLKLAIVPFALYAVHANWYVLRHAISVGYPPVKAAAVDACAFVHDWAAAHDDRANSVVAHPFSDWDFAGCSALPTIAPPEDRYDRIARADPLFLPSRHYMQQLVSAAQLPPLPAELQPGLGHFAHILILRPRSRPLADPAARLVHQGDELLFYDWPRH